jgi:type I restriction enzyme M protein
VYPQHGRYAITVDFNAKRIEYADVSIDDDARIHLGRETSSNFSQQENFVVLECVVRLLEKGYSPKSIELEKPYPSGHGDIWLDVLVKFPDGKPFLMIECKTWGREFEKEQTKMLAGGGQLFTYYKQAIGAKFLCLYSSHLCEGKIEYTNNIIDVQPEWASLLEVKDI